jgi:hypothetical protein
MNQTSRIPFLKIPNRQVFVGGILLFAIVLVAVFSGLIAGAYPPTFSVVLSGILGVGVLLISALIVPSKTVAPERLMRGALSLLLFTWVVWPSFISYKFGPLPGVNPTRLIYWGLISFWIYWVIASGNLKHQVMAALFHHKLFLAALLSFPAWQLFASFIGQATYPSIYFTIKASAGGLLLFFAAISIIRTSDQVETALTWALTAALVVAVIGIVEVLRGSSPFVAFLPSDPEQMAALDWIIQDKSRGGDYRISSTFAHPLTLGEYLLMCIPIAGYMAAIGSTRMRRVLALIYLPISAAAVYATHTRSTMIGVGVLLIIIFAAIGVGAIRKKANFNGAVAGALLLLFVSLGSIAVGTFAVNLAAGRDRGEQGSTNARLVQLDIGINELRKSPIYGFGPGMAVEKIGFLPGTKSLTIDNHYLSVALDTGLLGVAIYCLIFIFPIAIGLKLGISGHSPHHFMALATAVALIAFSFEKLVLSLTHNFDFAYILIAMTFVLKNIDLSKSTTSSEQT